VKINRRLCILVNRTAYFKIFLDSAKGRAAEGLGDVRESPSLIVGPVPYWGSGDEAPISPTIKERYYRLTTNFQHFFAINLN